MTKIKQTVINKAINERHFLCFYYEQRYYECIQPQSCYEVTDTLYLQAHNFQVFEVDKIEKLTVSKETF